MATRRDRFSSASYGLRPDADCPVARPLSQRRRFPWPLLVPLLLVVALLLLLPLVLGTPQQTRHDRRRGSHRSSASAGSQQPTTQAAASAPFVTRDADGGVHWPRPRTSERQRDRDRMVDSQIARGGSYRDAVKDQRVLVALRAVARHSFVPADQRFRAYADTPLPIGYGQTISQPFIVALMTELLEVEEGDKILEIGTGSGYQAAVLNELTPFVYTIEIVEPLHQQVVERFAKLGYKTIRARLGDGYDGWPEHAPFDGIIVTCAAGHVPPPLWDQLRPGGRMVIPIGGVFQTQRLLVLTKQRDGKRKSRSVLPVRFVPMTGKVQKP